MTTSSTAPRVYWVSPAPTACDLCGQALRTRFVDGRTKQGPWGCLCVLCHSLHGVGLGTGRGQGYAKQTDGRWLKIAG